MPTRRTFLQQLAATSVVATAAGCGDGDEEGTLDSDLTQQSTFEYIVIGSGAGGGPLASNLARAGHSVLLLEAGADRGESINYQVPAFHPKSTEDPSMRWDYFVKHYDDPARQQLDSKLTDQGVLYPRAGTLGGCTAHNAMITVYPHESDFDFIADLTGDGSWRASEMRRYFEILESCQYVSNLPSSKGHGTDGWLSTNLPDSKLAIGDLKLLTVVKGAAQAFSESEGGFFLGAISQIVQLMGRDLNEPGAERDQTEGVFTVPMATSKGKRNGPREFILDTIAEGFPLTLRMNALVSRIVFSKKKTADGKLRATSIEYLEGEHLYRADPNAPATGAGGKKRKVTATREIIVAAGAFNTPQLLKLSGIGPRDELEALGVSVKVDLPGVGTNLQDRYEVGIVHEVASDFDVLEDCTFGVEPDPCLDQWREKGRGIYAQNGPVVAIVKRSFDSEPDPDLFVFGVPGDFRGYEPGYSDLATARKDRFTWAVLKGHTKNKAGSVTLRSTDPRDVPEIRFRYFDEGDTDGAEDVSDLSAVVEGVDLVRRIGKRTDFLMPFGKFQEVFPGPSIDSPEKVSEFVKNEAWGHHASCTCKIGADDDPTAVLDSSFRVRGTAGLRVVDASVFPRIPGFFIVTAIYMISEKATDVLLGEIGESR